MNLQEGDRQAAECYSHNVCSIYEILNNPLFFFLENRLIPRSPSYTQLTHLDRKEINKRKYIQAVLVVKSLKKNENIIWLNS